MCTYVRRPDLEKQLRDHLHPNNNMDNRGEMQTVVICGLGGSGKSQLVLNYVQQHRYQYRAVFWVESGQKVTIERDYIQIYKQLYPDAMSTTVKISVDDAVTSVKTWLQQQEGRYLWVMDSADAIDDDESDDYIDIDHYMPDTPQLDRIITTRSSQAGTLSSKEAITVAELSKVEAAELLTKCAKLKTTGEEVEMEVIPIVQELGCLALAVSLAGSYIGKTPRLSSNLMLYLPEYKAHRQRLWRAEQEAYAMHKLVHAWSHDRLETAERQAYSLAASELLALVVLNNDGDSGSDTRMVPHVMANFAVMTAACGLDYDFEQRHRGVIGCFLDLLCRLGQWDNAYSICTTFCRVTEQKLGKNHSDSLTNMFILAFILTGNGEYMRAEEMHGNNLVQMEMVLGSEHALTIASMCNLGETLVLRGHYQQAEDRYLRALKLGLKVLSPGDPTIPALLNNLARVYAHQGQYSLAERISRQIVGESNDSIGLSGSMESLALALGKQGKYDEAEDLVRQALEERRRVSGEEHPQTLHLLHTLGFLLSEQGKYKQAEDVQREVLRLFNEVLGLDHPYTLAGTNNLATTLSRQGIHEEAGKLLRQVPDSSTRVQGSEHPATLSAMANLAWMLSEMGEYEEAELLHLQLLDIRRRLRWLEDPETLLVSDNLALVLRKQGKHREAEQAIRETLEVRQRTQGPDHPDILVCMNNLASVVAEQGLYEEAEDLSRRVLREAERLHFQEHPNTLLTMNNRAMILARREQFEEAIELLQQTLNLATRLLGQDHPRHNSMLAT